MADWTLLPADATATSTGPASQCDLRFFADVPLPDVARIVEETGERPVREGVRSRLAESEAVRRYARLRDEAAGLARSGRSERRP